MQDPETIDIYSLEEFLPYTTVYRKEGTGVQSLNSGDLAFTRLTKQRVGKFICNYM